MKTAKTSDYLLTAFAPLLFSSTYIVASEILPPDRPFTAALIRVLPAGLLLLLWQRKMPERGEWLKLLALATLNISAFQAFLFVSAYRLPGGQAAVVSALSPLILMLLVCLVDKQRFAWPAIAAGVASVLGMALLMLSPNMVSDGIGLAAALFSAVSLATGTWLMHRWKSSLSLPVLALSGWQLLLGGIMLAPLAGFFDAPLPALGIKEIAGYAYLTLFGTMLAYVLWFRGMQKLPPVAVGAIGLLSPIGAIILGWALLGQAISGQGLVGLVITLGSIGVIQRYSSGKKAPERAAVKTNVQTA